MAWRSWWAGWAALLAVIPGAFAWEIADFETDVRIRQDGTAAIIETILADFRAEPRHGIYRDIPIHYTDRAGQHFRLRLRVLDVTDDGGRPWRWRLESAGRDLRIRVGDPDRTVTGRQAYRLVYLVDRGAVRFFPDHDECYWNLTGNEWAVPMRRVSAVIRLPEGVRDVRAVAFVGSYGSTRQLDQVEIVDHTVRFSPGHGFQPYEGMTAAVAWAKGAVRPPGPVQIVRWWLGDNWIYGLPLATLLVMLWLWHAKGRDPRPTRSQVVEYEPPDHLTPAEMGTLMDQRVDLRDVTSTVVDLAVRGYLKIEPLESEGWWKERDYRLRLLKPWASDSALKPHEQALLDGLFGKTGDSVLLSSLKNVFYSELPEIRDRLYQTLVGSKLFDGHPERIRRRYLVLGTAIGGFLGWGLFAVRMWHQLPLLPVVLASALSGLIVIAFGWAMPRRSLRGAHLTDRIFGFLEFLRRTDEDRIRRINDPALFERLLPYALAFGVAEQWARAFEGIYTQPPSWYEGRWDTFSPGRFGRDLNRTMSSLGDTFTSQPRSSGSSGSFGGSGFGGGGFSGGGGGGGGGGSW